MNKVYNSIAVAALAILATSCGAKQEQKDERAPIKPKDNDAELIVDESPINPVVAKYMFYNEFTVVGQPLKIKGGEYAKGASVKVLFHDGTDYAIASPNVTVKGSNEIWAVVPEGVSNSHPVKIVVGEKEEVTDILFRDTRNVIVDFDTVEPQPFISGSSEKYPNLFTNANGDYGVFDDIKTWQAVVYQSAREGSKAKYPTVFGAFAADIADSKYNIRNFVIKFEVNVPKDSPVIGEAWEFGFCSGNDEDPIGNIRSCAAYWCPSEYIWNKDTDQWEIDDAKPFYTDGWMTVSIPFSELLWKSKNMSICADAANNGKYVNGAWTDYKHHYSYAQLHPDADEMERWGGFTINVNEYGSCLRREQYKLAVDNIRIVPDDGGGAVYLKKDYGMPVRHYSKKGTNDTVF